MTKKQTNTINSLIKQLENTKSQIDKTISKCRNRTNEKMVLINELIEECKKFDESYKEYCDELDIVKKLEQGTTYNDADGPKFFKEEEVWSHISFILRRLEGLDKT